MSEENSSRRTPDDDARPATLVCAGGITPDILSAWRDGLLEPDRAAALEAHVEGCDACRARLADYENAAAALTGQVIPRPGADMWPGVRAAIEQRMGPHSTTTAGRWRRLPRGLTVGGVSAAVAALLLIALFTGLLLGQRPRRPQQATTPVPTATGAGAVTATLAPSATAPAPSGPAAPGAWAALSDCASAPASVRTTYNAGISQQKFGPTVVTLQRTDTCGASWVSLTPPEIAGAHYGANVTDLSIFASPLDPMTAFLTVGVTGDASLCSSTVCQPQFVTTNGGASWSEISLPVPGLLGGGYVSHGHALSAQGNLLYGMVTEPEAGSSNVTPPGRLVVSSNGGLRWNPCDGALAAVGQGVYTAAIPATGSTLFVIAEPVNDPSAQAPTYAPTLTLWTSPDGGATWREGGAFPSSGQPGGMPTAGVTAGVVGGAPTLYDLKVTQGSMSLVATSDGGQTWTTDSQFPGFGVTGGEIPYFLGALPDGSAVIAQPLGSGPTLAWRPGGADRQVAANPGLLEVANPVFQQGAQGVYLYVTGGNGGGAQPVTEVVLLK